MKRQSTFLAVSILFFVSNSSYATTASFQGVGDLPGGNFYSYATGVSADGSVVVGYSHSASGYEAFRWENGVMVGLGHLSGPDPESYATGVSADGSVVVGYSLRYWNDYPEAFRWTQETGMVGLGYVPNSDIGSYALGVSPDGSVVVGGSGGRWDLNGEAFRWENGQMVNLGNLQGSYSWSDAFGVSSDGSVIVGNSEPSEGFEGFDEAFRWENGTMVGLGSLPGGSISSSGAYDVSADGSVVVGISLSSLGFEAFRWTAETGMVGLGKLWDYPAYEYALDCTADGSVIVGKSVRDSGYRAFIWDAENGMRDLRSVLINDYGLELFDWSLYSAEAITDNGSTIAGWGSHWNQDLGMWCREGWIATIPEPASILSLGLGFLFLKKKHDKR